MEVQPASELWGQAEDAGGEQLGVSRALDPVPTAAEWMFRIHAAGRLAWDREPAAHCGAALLLYPGCSCLQSGSAHLCQPG